MLAMLLASAGGRAEEQPQPVVDAGVEYGGGYYAGEDVVVDGVSYLVIVAPKSQGEAISFQWSSAYAPPNIPEAQSSIDGRANTAAIISAGASSHPAANLCNNLVINGHEDWHLPAIDELNICYTHLEPTYYTPAIPFRIGGAEAFIRDNYWSSTQHGTSSFARTKSFNNGNVAWPSKGVGRNVRAVRWEKRL